LIRIVIADDHEVIRRGLREMLEQHVDWQVCGEAANGRQAVDLALKTFPQVVILDLMMPQMNGVEATRAIKNALPNTEVLIFTEHESDELVHHVITAGARGYLLKSDRMLDVVAAIEALIEHRPYFTWSVAKKMLDAYLAEQTSSADVPLSNLTGQEREIVQLLAEGRSHKAIAATLGVSIKTLETRRAAIMKKLGAKSIAELVRYAVRNKVIEA